MKRRQNKFILRNQPDILEDICEKNYLDEGESNSENEAPKEVSSKIYTRNSEDEYNEALLDDVLSEKKNKV